MPQELTGKRAVAQRKKKHEYAVKYRTRNPWTKTLGHIKDRCNRKNDVGYKKYGAKGIKCLITLDELKTLWFRDGASSMECPSIDRINPKDHYRFDNCRYIELRENSRLMALATRARKIVRINHDGTETEFESILEADRAHGYKGTGGGQVSYAIRNGSNKAHGFMWRASFR